MSEPIFQLRKAEETDLHQLKKMIHDASLNPIGVRWHHFIVAIDENDNIIGCGQCKPHSDGTIELASIIVLPAYRQQGVASGLIQQLISAVNSTIYLMCNKKLEPFYKQFDFYAISPAEMPPYFSRVYRLFAIAKRLSKSENSLSIMKRELK